ncbi:UDP-2,3-diacylglucosamine diphosphatase [Xylanibacter brevis]|uniref:UDP-2,3-diacylglucosamine diphosphatase n=1 Tax=Xylanibacter brevis TaxID=83231 RepID=UPI00047FA984|nr:UDP-2,3-diacylglucosamine diphosphatase [Xylanibacter brevis]
MKSIYFLSDAHLGSWALDHRRMQERRLVRFLDSIKDKAAAIYLLGDMFDFWYEYKFVVPRGYTRFLGKLSELTDMGVEVHYFTGNHDIWAFNYLERECGVILHKQPLTVELYGKIFFMAHGDGLGDPDKKFKFIRAVFHNPVCQHLFSAIHPRWGMWFGQTWARHSRMKRPNGEEPPYMGEDREHLILYTKDYMKTHPNVDVFIYGHRHIEIDLQVSKKARAIILGDWISQFSYVVYDGEHLFMQQYIEGESKV